MRDVVVVWVDVVLFVVRVILVRCWVLFRVCVDRVCLILVSVDGVMERFVVLSLIRIMVSSGLVVVLL